MVNYKWHVSLITLGVLALLLTSTAIFIRFDKSQGNDDPRPFPGGHDNDQKNRARTSSELHGKLDKGCCGENTNNAPVNKAINTKMPKSLYFDDNYGPELDAKEERKNEIDECGCNCSNKK
jgi:hypothetical protein